MYKTNLETLQQQNLARCCIIRPSNTIRMTNFREITMLLIALTLCLSERVLIVSEDVCRLSKRSRRETLGVAILSVILATGQSDAFHAASFYAVCTTITTGQMMTHATKFRARNVRGMVERGGRGAEAVARKTEKDCPKTRQP